MTTPKRPMSRRSRRLWWTTGSLVAVGLIGLGIVLTLSLLSRQTTHGTGEEIEGITRKLTHAMVEDAPLPRFTDITADSGITFQPFEGTRTSRIPEDMGSGAAWGDFDNDGDDDLFLVSAGGSMDLPPENLAPSQLYENLGAGRFRLVDDFPETRIMGMGAAWADFDGDGWQDLVVSGFNSLLLFRNEQGRLVRHPGLGDHKGFWTGVSWGDYDNDRDLDLYVCGYVKFIPTPAGNPAAMQYGRHVPFTLNPSSYEPEPNLLFRNDGDGTFTEVAAELGVHNPEGRSFTGLWHDFDGDGWTDLYVANDISDNTFYLNQDGRFTEISHPAMVADYRGAMGLALGDWNADGDDDLFITHWIAQENALYDSLLAELEEPPAGTPIRFIDIADRVGLGQVALQFIGWGTEFADFDADGWLDLVVANGSTFETESSPPGLRPQAPFLFWNRQGKSFYDLAPLDPDLAIPHVGRGLALSDWDDDGDLDILIMNHSEGAQLLRNDMATGGWVKIRLRSRLAQAGAAVGAGEGTVLVAEVAGHKLRRTITTTSYLSQSSRTVHFGIGSAAEISSLEVRWPGGEIAHYRNLPADTRWEIREGDAEAHAMAPRGENREQTASFWANQRAAVRALKVDADCSRAIHLFRAALALRPDHEGSLFYLGQCLVETGDTEGALDQFATLLRLNPANQRVLSQWGQVRAASATSMEDLNAAASALERAAKINPEETGTLLALAEINLLRGEGARAEQRLEWACRTNRRAVVGFFLRGFLAWEQGDQQGARKFLAQALTARGPDWKPDGGTAEGDMKTSVKARQTLLSPFEENWTGSLDDLDQVFRDLAAFTEKFRRMNGDHASISWALLESTIVEA